MTIRPFVVTDHAPGEKVPVRVHLNGSTSIGYMTVGESMTDGDVTRYSLKFTDDHTAQPRYEMLFVPKDAPEPLDRIDRLIADEAAKDWEL